MMGLIIVLALIIIWSLWKFMKWIRKKKTILSVAYLIVFIGFATILVSIFYPGGFEGMGIALIGLFIGLISLLFVIIYTIFNKIKNRK
jgi:hypothetical protein